MVSDRHESVRDRRKASQNGQHDRLMNTEVLYIYIFHFFN